MKITKVVLAGGSGFIGNYLKNYFQINKVQVIILSRKFIQNNCTNTTNIRQVCWDGISSGLFSKTLENTDLLINLSGKNIQCLFNKKNKNELLNSRINGIKILHQCIKNLKNPPKLWIQASGLGFYGNTTTLCDEFSKKGIGFLSDMAEKLEDTLFKEKFFLTRKIILRFGLAFHYSGGVLQKLVKLTKNFGGISIGDGKMYIAWFHLFDLIRIINFLFKHDSLEGIFNICTPHPILHKDFIKILNNHFNKRFIIPTIPQFIFKLIAKNLMNIEPELVLHSQQVTSKKLTTLGFKFIFNDLSSTLLNLYPNK